MSWLYTIVVAGLLFANGTDLDIPVLENAAPNPSVRSGGDVIEKFSQTYSLSPNGRVSVSNANGPIVLEAWDRNEVQVEITKIADSQESLDLLDIDITAKRDSIRIEATIDSWGASATHEQLRGRKIEGHFRLKIPRGAVLNQIEVVNGNVTASNFINFTRISAANGNVTARNLQGTCKLSTVNGELKTIFEDLGPVSSAELETVNGRVYLEIPSDANATVRADSRNGTIGNDFGLPVQKGRPVGRDLHGRIGAGTTSLRLTSINGGIFLTRRKDGKAPSAITNLLNSRSNEADDDDGPTAVEAVTRESVVRTVNRAGRTAERSVKAAEKDLEKAHAQAEKLKKDELADVKVKLSEKEFESLMGDAFKHAAAAAAISEGMWSAASISMEQRTATFGVKGTPKVNVDASMCAVRVRGWDQPTVKYVLTEQRGAKDGPLRITQNASETTVSIKVANPARPAPGFPMWDDENRFRIEVYVPKTADLVVTTNRDLRVEGVTGKLELNGSEGAVSVRDSEGNLKLTSDDGLVRVIGFRGDLDITTSESDVYLEGNFSKITADAGDANITLTMPATQNASIFTNTAIQSEGLNIVRDGDRRWRLGSGGPKYDFVFAEGQLIVRNQSRVDVN